MTKSIAITGHTQGIGSAIYERLGYSGYQCKGYSRSTGWDIVAQHKQLLKEIEQRMAREERIKKAKTMENTL